jgi:hypothetical protein
MSPSVVCKTLLLDSANSLKSLWVCGLTLLSIFLCSSFSPFDEEQTEWAQYLLLGTALPLATFCLSFIEHKFKYIESPLTILKIGLGLFALVISVTYLFYFNGITVNILILSISSWVLMLTIVVGSVYAKNRVPQGVDIPTGLIAFVIVVISWALSIKLIWWQPFVSWLESSYFPVLIFIVSFILVSINLLLFHNFKIEGSPHLLSVENIIAIGIFGLFSIRIEPLTLTSTGMHIPDVGFLHWSVFIGPAEMVRQGGWLLWDVPSQYGFLNILLLSTFPAKSIWQALYIIDSLLYLFVSTILFLFLRSWRRGIINYVFSFLITVASTFMLTGWAVDLSGPHLLPSAGPFRFCWCYVLLLMLFWHYKAKPQTNRPLWLGTIAWLIGTLWSFESALYCAGIWLPAYCCIILERTSVPIFPNQTRTFNPKGVLLLLLPSALLIVAIGAIIVFYRSQLGHSPDWFMFVEYSFAFREGFGALFIDRAGGVWILVLVFSLLSTIVALSFNRYFSFTHFSVMLGFWGALWTTSSYFIGRSHDFVIATLSPIWVGGIALSIYLLDRIEEFNKSVLLMRISVIPVLTVLLTLGFGNRAGIEKYCAYLKNGYCKDVRKLLPTMDRSLVDLLNSANARPEDATIWLNASELSVLPFNYPFRDEEGNVVRNNRAWLPVSPYILFWPLSLDRSQLYISRFASRSCLSGWLVESKVIHPDMPWLFEQLGVTHTAINTYENAEWKVTWYAVRMSE